jgi:hypothetical protein
MSDDRLRVTLDAPYASALGLAMFCFARCEWDAVWCCERLQPGFIATIEPKRKTAGIIAKDLLRLVTSIADNDLRLHCQEIANEFDSLVLERNALLHGKPGTATAGAQRLFRHGSVWTIETVDALSDSFTRCQVRLNDLVHVRLAK